MPVADSTLIQALSAIALIQSLSVSLGLSTSTSLWSSSVDFALATLAIVLQARIPHIWHTYPAAISALVPLVSPYPVLSCVSVALLLAVSVVFLIILPPRLEIRGLKMGRFGMAVVRCPIELETSTADGADDSGLRGLIVGDAWFPMKLKPDRKAKAMWIPAYALNSYATALAHLFGLPTYRRLAALFWYFGSMETRASEIGVEAVAVAEAESERVFPVVIFSHGLHGMPVNYSTLCESIASHGYVVFAVCHRDGSAPCVIHPTLGELQSDRERRVPHDDDRLGYQAMLSVRVAELNAMRSSLNRVMLSANGNVSGTGTGTDLGPVPIQNMVRFDPSPNRAILIGHSFGGAAVAMAVAMALQGSVGSIDSNNDNRNGNGNGKGHKSVSVLLDPWLWPLRAPDWGAGRDSSQSTTTTSTLTLDPRLNLSIPKGVDTDTLIINSKWAFDKIERSILIDRLVEGYVNANVSANVKRVDMESATHHSFNDLPFLVRSAWLRGVLGFSSSTSASANSDSAIGLDLAEGDGNGLSAPVLVFRAILGEILEFIGE